MSNTLVGPMPKFPTPWEARGKRIYAANGAEVDCGIDSEGDSDDDRALAALIAETMNARFVGEDLRARRRAFPSHIPTR